MEFHFRRHFRLRSKMKNAFRSAYTSQKGLGLENKVLVLILVLKKVSITSLVLCYVKLWNCWRIFRKNIPLSLKMLSASGGLRPPTGPSPLDPTEGLPSPRPSLLYSPKYTWNILYGFFYQLKNEYESHEIAVDIQTAGPTARRRRPADFFFIRGLTQSLF